MKRWVSLGLFSFIFCSNSGWAKWKPEEQAYLDNQFQNLQVQIQALKKQSDALAAQVDELRQNQAAIQTVLIHQQRAFEDLEQLITSLRLGDEEHFSNLKTAVSQLRDEQEKAFNTLGGHTVQGAAGGAAQTDATMIPAPPAKPFIRGYVIQAQGDVLTIDLGSLQGLHPGSRLFLYKSSDPNTQVGEIEVTEVVDSSNSHARVVNIQPKVKPEFTDIVRLE